MMTIIRVIWGKKSLFFNFGCDKFTHEFIEFLNVYGWKNYTIFHDSCNVVSIGKSDENMKSEMIGMFWNWLHQETGGVA
jgi:hypothetical protein